MRSWSKQCVRRSPHPVPFNGDVAGAIMTAEGVDLLGVGGT
jgi:hypothetical protein